MKHILCLLAIGLAGVTAGAVTGQLATAYAAPKRADALFGTERGPSWDQAASETSGLTAQRVYSGKSQDGTVPPSWPPVPAGIRGVYSFKPDLAAVNSGTADQAIIDSLRSLPPGSWVTIWHEANIRPGFPMAAYLAAIRHVAGLVAVHGIPVRFGQIFSTRETQDLRPWVVPRLGFYGVDGYGQPAQPDRTPAVIFGHSFTAIRDAYPQATLAVTETDVVNGTVTQTDRWDRAAWKFACQNRAAAFLLWSLPGTGINLPDAKTLRYLARATAQGRC
jgi:hypothetical protein